MPKTRVLIVDDSPTMRRLLRAVLEPDPRLEIVAEASSASAARDAVNTYRPDVMTLDVEMPNMSGLEFLERLMRHRPMPVVMVSTLTRKGSRAAIEALSLGAVECVEKPKAGTSDVFNKLADTLVMAGAAQVRQLPPRKTNQDRQTTLPAFAGSDRIALIGGSTGAVEAIERILTSFPDNCPPTLITQHMPAPFLASFAARLEPLVAPKVRLAKDGDELMPGQVLIAPGGEFHLELDSSGLRTRIALVKAPEESGHRPSVDRLFRSAVPIAHRVVATILTGMGRDGAAGLSELKRAGAATIGQSEESCVVFGMPRVAGEMGGVEKWADLNGIAREILSRCASRKEGAR
ncbi:MAG: protein-glutamate methylesterase/protein-glutamine glutaminase [Paracoccaceae bacterium]